MPGDDDGPEGEEAASAHIVDFAAKSVMPAESVRFYRPPLFDIPDISVYSTAIVQALARINQHEELARPVIAATALAQPLLRMQAQVDLLGPAMTATITSALAASQMVNDFVDRFSEWRDQTLGSLVFRLPDITMHAVSVVAATTAAIGPYWRPPFEVIAGYERLLAATLQPERPAVESVFTRLDALGLGANSVTSASALRDLDTSTRRRNWTQGGPQENRAAARGAQEEVWEETQSGLILPWQEAREDARARLSAVMNGLDKSAVEALSSVWHLLRNPMPFVGQHIANALVEAVDRTLRAAAPEKETLAWRAQPDRKTATDELWEDRPTRALRIRYITRNWDSRLQDFASATEVQLIASVKQAQSVKHKRNYPARVMQALAVSIDTNLVVLLCTEPF